MRERNGTQWDSHEYQDIVSKGDNDYWYSLKDSKSHDSGYDSEQRRRIGVMGNDDFWRGNKDCKNQNLSVDSLSIQLLWLNILEKWREHNCLEIVLENNWINCKKLLEESWVFERSIELRDEKETFDIEW